MSKPRVYVETSIPSFYHTRRKSPGAIARQDWTRRWWAVARERYLLLTSEAVLIELRAGSDPIREKRLAMLADLPRLASGPPVVEILETYFRHRLMPRDPSGDALHLALASYHRCDFLVTWNCRHLANANKFGQIRRINTKLGLYVPTLATPMELLGEYDEGEA